MFALAQHAGTLRQDLFGRLRWLQAGELRVSYGPVIEADRERWLSSLVSVIYLNNHALLAPSPVTEFLADVDQVPPLENTHGSAPGLARQQLHGDSGATQRFSHALNSALDFLVREYLADADQLPPCSRLGRCGALRDNC
jgi:hypothetical protein